jgi:LuxR family transcriptional regulator, maltose regulon positive regulatory protein
MPKAAQYRMIWHSERQTYELHEHPGGHLLTVTPGEQTWFAWLDTVPSFTFRGKLGQFTVRKESRQWGDRYWYAYRRVGPKLTKKYLGRTADLTLVRLEEVAALLTGAEISPRKEAAVRAPSNELVQDRQRSRRAVEVDVPAVGADAITGPSARPGGSRDPLLFTKLHVPRPRAQLVPRSHLTLRLHQGMECALTLVSAPAGFGKTTLLAQWLAESSRPVAWLSLEPEDNEPMRFLSYLIAAFQTLDPHIGTTALSLLHTPQTTPPETILTLLINELERREGGAYILILDDYHVITAEPLHRALRFLLEHLPPRMYLIISTRADPPLPLARLRAIGQLTELRAVELRFGVAETDVFLKEVMGLHLPLEDVTTLQARTEGWIAGLQLAALSLQDRTDVSTFLATFTGKHRFVLDYLSDEVLARQPAEVQAFLLRTSILERLNGPLCDAVTGQEGGQHMLETLEKANLFVVSLDEERQWYRYHHLFAEVLCNRLRHIEPMLVPELYLRASVWYERQGLPIEAVQHALAASDVERAADLIEHIGMSVGYRGQVHTVLKWLNALPDVLVRTRPALCIYHALTLIFIGQMEEAEARLRDAEHCIHVGMPVEQARSIQGQVTLIRGNISRYSGDLTHSVALSLQALDLLQEKEMMHTGALVYAAQAYLVSGDVTSAPEHKAKTAVQLARNSNQLFLSLRSIINLARLQVLQGRLRQATTTYEEAMQVTSGPEVLRVLTSGPAYYFGLADVLREWNDLDEASRYLAQGMEVLESGTLLIDADVVMLGYVTLARLQLARSAYGKALAALDTFVNLTHQRQIIPLLVAQVAAMRAYVDLEHGNLTAALRWMDASGLSTGDADLAYPREREYLTLARVQIALARADPTGTFLQDTLGLLARLLSDAEAKARMSSVLEILLLRSLAFDTQGNKTQALRSLERALLLAEPEGYVRLFVDEGMLMLALLREAQRHGLALDYLTRLLFAFDTEHISDPVSPIPANHTLLEPLTARERDVLRLLVAGLTNAAIAQELVITLGTVKRHVNSIYGKLGVQSRTQAVARAHAMHLL